jgi:hypothetical protein
VSAVPRLAPALRALRAERMSGERVPAAAAESIECAIAGSLPALVTDHARGGR